MQTRKGILNRMFEVDDWDLGMIYFTPVVGRMPESCAYRDQFLFPISNEIRG